MKHALIIIATSLFTSCGFYYMDNRPPSITTIDTKVSSVFVYEYYDSFPEASWTFTTSKQMVRAAPSNDAALRSKMYYFPAPHEEMYEVRFTWPIVISRIYTASSRKWICGDSISDVERNRITKRFENEVMTPMVNFAHERNISDSVIYTK